jgi:hypothetical protein
MTVMAIGSKDGVTLDVAQNRLLEEWRKRKGQPKAGLLTTAMHSHVANSSHKGGCKPRISSANQNSSMNSNQLYLARTVKKGATSSHHVRQSILI